MEKTLEILLSGILGAVIAALLTVWYQHFSEHSKSRKNTMRAVMEWVDNIYLRLQSMQVDKERVYIGKSGSLSEVEYRSMSEEVRVLLLSNRITTEVVCVYGEGDILQKINALQGELTKAASILWASKQDTWSESSKKIMEIFQKKIDPLIASVMGDFLKSTGKVSILRREQMTSRIKKIIAREGLILIGIIGLGYVITVTPDLYIQWPAPIRVYQPTDKSMPIDLLVEQEIDRKDRPIDLLTETRIVNLNTGASEIYSKSAFDNTQEKRKQVKKIGFIILLFGYPVYLVVRFVFWAGIILKSKEWENMGQRPI